MGFREIVDYLIPAHFTEGEGGLKLLTFATLVDASVERVRQGLESRFPSRAGDSALALIGADRGIPRGRAETAAHYAARLVRWRWPRGHRTRGTAYALLEQVSEYFGGVLAKTITRRGRYYTRTAAGAESWATGASWEWDAIAALPNWGRFWLRVDPVGSDVSVRAADYYGSTEGTIGLSGFAYEDAQAMRGLMRGAHPWKPHGVRGEWLIFAADASPTTPDGRWDRWSYVSFGGTQAAVRAASWRFVSLSPETNNRYSGDPELFCTDCIYGGSFYGGDKTSFPASVTLPSGEDYAGDPGSFPVNVLLLDDGDAP
jgi:hypothetical protein